LTVLLLIIHHEQMNIKQLGLLNILKLTSIVGETPHAWLITLRGIYRLLYQR